MEAPSIGSVSVVSEYSDVFPNNLSGSPLIETYIFVLT